MRNQGQQRDHAAESRIGEEGRGERDGVGEEPARYRSEADREEKNALVDRHHAAAVGAARNVGNDDLRAGDDHGRPRAGYESPGQKLPVVIGEDHCRSSRRR